MATRKTGSKSAPKVKRFTDTDGHQWGVSFEFIDFSDEWLQKKNC